MVNIKKAFVTSESIVYDFWYDDGKPEQVKYNYYSGDVHLMHPQRLEDLAPGYLRDLVTEQAEKDFESWKKQWTK